MRSASFVVAATAGLALLATAKPARADDDVANEQHDPAFQYTRPTRPNYVRAAVENVLVLGLGYTEYTLDKSNQQDWDLNYDWRSMRSKLLFDSVTFDNNRFTTNWVTHPGAGILYYWAARSNRMAVAPSFVMAFASSTFWEYVGEWKEQVAINDVMVTPVTGIGFGEPMLQIGSFLHRSRPTVLTRGIAWVFAPFKSLHDLMDGLEPKQADRFDDLGLAADDYHRFQLMAEFGMTHQENGVTQSDMRLSADSRIVALRDYGGAGRHEGWFESAEVSEIGSTFTVSDHSQITDFRVAGNLLPAGYRWQDVRIDEHGDLRGSSFLGGFEVGVEYGTHDYDRDGRRPLDHVAMLAGGAQFEEIVHLRGLSLRGRLDVLGTFAGVDAYALPWYRRDYGDLRLTSVLRYHGYYHAYGGTVHPELEARFGADERLRVGGDARVDYFDAITGADVEPIARVPEAPANDRRIWSNAWIRFAATNHVQLTLTGFHRVRAGTMPGASASRSELGAYFGADVVF